MTIETAIAALRSYGYVLREATYVIPGRFTDSWAPQEEGFLRWNRGRPIPHSVNPESARQEGLSNTDPDHAEGFEWVYPADEVEKIYSYAADQASKGWPTEGEAHHKE